jgi:hypothetical protein
MLIFCDGFDHYATADITKKWTTFKGGALQTHINPSGGRRGGGCFETTIDECYIQRTYNSAASWIIGVAYKYEHEATYGPPGIIALLDNGSYQCEVRLDEDSTLSVTRNGNSVSGGKGTQAISAGVWHYIEFKVTIGTSIAAGTCVVKVDGATVVTVAAGQSVQNTVNASANQVRIGAMGVTYFAGTTQFDDHYICNPSGAHNNDFLGDVRVDTLFPTSDGHYTDWTPSSGSSHFALVDDATPDLGTYVGSTTVGNRDSYGMSELEPLVSQTVYGVQVNVAVLKDTTGLRSIETFLRSNSVDVDGATAAISTDQAFISQVFETNPDGGVAWTETTVDAAEAGVKVSA